MRVKVVIYFFILLMCVLRSASRRRRRRQSCSRVDCVVHSWSSWSPCSAKRCGQAGTQERRRTVHLPPICGGTACPSLVDIVPCQGNAPADCQLSSWSSWSTCSLPCGGTQTSSRYVVTKEQCGGVPCNSTLRKTRACKVARCFNQGTLVGGHCSCLSGYFGGCCEHNSK